MIELKPCPFCGKEAKLETKFGNSDRPIEFKIVCQNVDCMATIVKKVIRKSPRPPKGVGLEQLDTKYKLKDQLYHNWCNERINVIVNAWNRRVTDD